jgi:DNA-binding response OmpR family regulator
MAEETKKFKVLVIEDDAVIEKALSLIFMNDDYEVLVANNGEEGLKMIKEIKPDIILLDLLLPKLNGFDVLKQTKEDINVSNIPVIVLSNLGEDENLKKAMALGALDYHVKIDVNLDELLNKVNKVLKK